MLLLPPSVRLPRNDADCKRSSERMRRPWSRRSLRCLARVARSFMVGSGGCTCRSRAWARIRRQPPRSDPILRRELRAFDICVTYVDPGAVDTAMTRAGMAGAPPKVLVPPELVARKILLATATRPRVLNVAPVSAVAVALADFFPRLTEIFLERNPALTGSAPISPQPMLAEPKPVEVLAAAPPEPAHAVLLRAVVVDETADEPADDPVDQDEIDRRPMPSPFDAALETLQRRMERAHLEPAFVRGLLVPETVIDVAEVAMRWADAEQARARADHRGLRTG